MRQFWGRDRNFAKHKRGRWNNNVSVEELSGKVSKVHKCISYDSINQSHSISNHLHKRISETTVQMHVKLCYSSVSPVLWLTH